MSARAFEILRYILNGLVATAVHFGVLAFNLEILEIPSAGLSNLIAAVFGIASSFIGSRYFVFPATDASILSQAMKFSGLYGVIALLHGLVLLAWSDWFGMDYRWGFLIATCLQVSLSYIGNKYLVFK